ncbi:ribosome-binding factor A [bacterium BMS3Abin15]|nr:ribosome-binding factor A [bacterium BMS3Abin15]HDH07721.1 30S ribosome-binding factor RbfA [Candidatus Moranbacteria bacterium]HDZ85118.1 30S ribosome-binding factor RbfA [Candidatus Moranbacteria bacterium]
MSHRISKINELIKQQVSEIISRELNIKPGVFLTIAKVDTAKDLRYTKIFVSVFPEKEAEYALKTLEKEIYNIQGILNKKLHLKIIPKIEFVMDTTEVEADEIEKILKEINSQ